MHTYSRQTIPVMINSKKHDACMIIAFDNDDSYESEDPGESEDIANGDLEVKCVTVTISLNCISGEAVLSGIVCENLSDIVTAINENKIIEDALNDFNECANEVLALLK
jgi:hypothetical protein